MRGVRDTWRGGDEGAQGREGGEGWGKDEEQR